MATTQSGRTRHFFAPFQRLALLVTAGFLLSGHHFQSSCCPGVHNAGLHTEGIYAPGTPLTSADFVLHGNDRWPEDDIGFRTTVTYSIHPNMTNGTLPGGLKCEEVRAAIEEALGLWAKHAPLHFIEIPDAGPAPGDGNYSASGTANIRYSHHRIDGALGSLAHTYYPSSQSNGLAGDVHFDDSETWAVKPGGNKYDLLEATVHETGHALGLGHQPGPPEGVDANMNPYYDARFSGLGTATLRPDDIAGIREIYGIGIGSVRPMEALACGASLPTCPAQATLQAALDLPLPPELKTMLWRSGPNNILDTFRKFRDETLRNSKLGNEWIRLYYEHSAELRKLALADPKSTAEAAQLLMRIYPAVNSAMARGGRLELDAATHAQLLEFMDRYDSRAGASLHAAIQSVRSALVENSISAGDSVIIVLGNTG